MKKTALVVTLAMLLVPMASSAGGSEDGAAIYKAKCQSCHGPDGKKNAKKDLSSAAVQGKSDKDLVAFLTTNGMHKSKVAGAGDAEAVISFVRTLKK